MIPVSTTRLPWLLAALLVAAPLIYANVLRTHDECGSGSRAAPLTGVAGIERVERHRDSIFQWTSREEKTPGVLSHAVIRARKPRVLADPGSLAKSRVILSSRSEVRHRSLGGIDLPIHFDRTEDAGHSRFSAYLFIYADRPVESLLHQQIAAGWEPLPFGRRPVTVMMAWGIGTPEQARRLEAEATHWIVETWKLFASQCGS
jgi:hypothetical protein